MKKTIVIILFCSLLIAINSGCGSKSEKKDTTETSSATEQGQTPAKEKFVKLAKDINKNMPMPVPGGIRMDKAEAVSDKDFKYYYTFTQAPSVSPEEFTRTTKLALILAFQSAKGDDLDMFRKDKMNLIYAYYTKDSELFAEIKLTPEDYSK